MNERLYIARIKYEFKKRFSANKVPNLYKLDKASWEFITSSGIFDYDAPYETVVSSQVIDMLAEYDYMTISEMTRPLYIDVPPTDMIDKEMIAMIINGSTWIGGDGKILDIEFQDSNIGIYRSKVDSLILNNLEKV